MTAKYLYSLPPELKAGGGVYAEAGIPVVPWYMVQPPNMFVAAGTIRLSPYAEVWDREIDLDAVAQRLFEDFPGIPLQVHENYVMATALAAAQLKAGTRVRPLITSSEASIQVFNETTVIQLWTTPPTKGKLT